MKGFKKLLCFVLVFVFLIPAGAIRAEESFDRITFFRDQLTPVQQELFDACLSALEDGKTNFSIDKEVDEKDPWIALMAVYDAVPELLEWISFYDVYEVYLDKELTKPCGLELSKSKYYKKSLERKTREKINKVVAKAKRFAEENYPEDPEYGICLYFEDWLCKKNYYRYAALKEKNRYKPMNYYSHTSYGCFLKGYGVCESYARAMSRLLDAAGITNLYATGKIEASEGSFYHAWNQVLIGGEWYLLDTTNDDDDKKKNSGSSYRFFLTGSSHAEKEQVFHNALGAIYEGLGTFSFPEISYDNYLKEEDSTEVTEEPAEPVESMEPAAAA